MSFRNRLPLIQISNIDTSCSVIRLANVECSTMIFAINLFNNIINFLRQDQAHRTSAYWWNRTFLNHNNLLVAHAAEYAYIYTYTYIYIIYSSSLAYIYICQIWVNNKISRWSHLCTNRLDFNIQNWPCINAFHFMSNTF